MKTRASLKKRSADCKIVRRKGRLFVINKKNPKMKLFRVRFTSSSSKADLNLLYYVRRLSIWIGNSSSTWRAFSR